MICPKCGTENVGHARYCKSCGTALKSLSRVTKAQLEDQIAQKDVELASLRKQLAVERQPVTKSLDVNSLSSNGDGIMHLLGLAVAVILMLICVSQCNDKENAIKENDELSHTLSLIRTKNNQLEKTVTDIGNIQPVFVSKIEVRNADGKYGETIYSKNTTYINIRVSTISLVNRDVNVYVKMITPQGVVSRGDNSPKGYSYMQTIHAKRGEYKSIEFTGWGRDRKGFWWAGTYKFELYIDGKLVGEKSLTIR